MKRIVAILVALTLALSLAAACGPAESKPSTTGGNPSTTGTGEAKTLAKLSPDNPHTLTVWLTSTYTKPNADNVLSKLLKDELGITLEYTVVTPDNASTVLGTMLAGGKFPDLIGTTDQNARFITGGALIPLDDYLKSDVAPLLYEHVKPYWERLSYDPDKRDDDPTKHVYIFPNYNRYYGEITGGTNYSAPGFWIQKAVLADAGYPDLTNMTLDRYFELIENYKAKYPEIDGIKTVGFEILNVTGREWGLTNPPQHLAGQPNNGGVIVDENNIAHVFATDDISYKYYKKLNEEYNKGIVDDSASTLDGYFATLAKGNVLGMFDQRWGFGTPNDSLASDGKYERQWVSLMPTYDGVAPWYADREVMNVNQGFGVSVSCTQPDVAVAFLEEMLSDKWQKRLSWGIEGEDYEVNAEGRFYRTKAQRDQGSDSAYLITHKLQALQDLLPKRQGTYEDGNAYGPGDQPEEFFDSLSAYDKEFLTNYTAAAAADSSRGDAGKTYKTWRDFLNQPKDNPIYYPAWNIPLEDGSDAQKANRNMTQVSGTYLPSLYRCRADQFDALWDEFKSEMGKVDIKAYEDAINAGIQDRIRELS